MIGVGDETGTKDEGKIWEKVGQRGQEEREGRTGRCHEILV